MNKPITMHIDDPEAINLAVKLVKSGQLIAFPTDTVYGIGTSAFEADAIERIYSAKGRSSLKAIPILLGDADGLEQITPSPTQTVIRLIENFWPGPLTLVLPLLSSLPDNLSPTPTIGLRIPDHKFTRELLRKTGPMAATSANLTGKPSALTAVEVQTQLGGSVDLILDGGRSPGGRASTVLDCTTDPPTLLRDGPLSWEEIQAILNDSSS